MHFSLTDLLGLSCMYPLQVEL